MNVSRPAIVETRIGDDAVVECQRRFLMNDEKRFPAQIFEIAAGKVKSTYPGGHYTVQPANVHHSVEARITKAQMLPQASGR